MKTRFTKKQQKKQTATIPSVPMRVTRSSKKSTGTIFNRNFTDLNDDCIEEIFRRLPTVELCKFTVLNKRLKLLAEDVFKRIYGNKILTFKPFETCATQNGVKTTNQFMRSFGKYMQQIQIIGTDKEDEKAMEAKMLSAISRYPMKNLQSLTLVQMDFNETTISQLDKILEIVIQLTVENCRVSCMTIDMYELLFKRCYRLRTLNLIQCSWNHHSWLCRRYDTLRTIQVLRSVFNQGDVEQFFHLNPHVQEVWFNVRTRQLTHPYDEDRLHRCLFIAGFDEGQYCLRFLRTYTTIVVKSVILIRSHLTEEKCDVIAKMTDIKEVKLLHPMSLYDDFVKKLSIGLVNLTTVLLSGELFTFQTICEFLHLFPKLEFMYLYKTGFDSIGEEQFQQLIDTRQRAATIATENYPLTIFVDRTTPIYVRALWRKFKHIKNIKIVTMKSTDFQCKFAGMK